MKNLYCWRCKMEIPMLDEEEFHQIYELYGKCFRNFKELKGKSISERFQPVLDLYEQLTGFKETNINAILHHRVSMYGPPCENCGKPYRTSLAKLCAACGHKRISF